MSYSTREVLQSAGKSLAVYADYSEALSRRSYRLRSKVSVELAFIDSDLSHPIGYVLVPKVDEARWVKPCLGVGRSKGYCMALRSDGERQGGVMLCTKSPSLDLLCENQKTNALHDGRRADRISAVKRGEANFALCEPGEVSP